MTAPIRTCIGCRARRPAADLVRIVAVDGGLALGAGRPGRGAWLCAADYDACGEQALRRRAFERALRARLVGPVELPVRAAVTGS